ncbi:SHOCT domain-containing protein (plasmid) [Alkalihalobacillus hwajinpoensis]|uniref:SHOCT domain-containing protein n=1 Tax=Guptibacillus hwajinpoensis TaxID=208199 RepID=UPI0018848D6D|nr:MULTISPECIES: SHOCT domain-containing protein [Bacillaceae]MBF0706564.1 SHOCT domain-containing protein [Pseudalkalibacillus hwajinpoensis]MDP4553537.1 SHOCT domain-containing protein [Alkalihalobacillus macyae]
MMMGWGVISMLLWIVILGFIIYGITVLVRKPFDKKEDHSLQILKDRLAKGEIDEKEYNDKRAILKSRD